jgi:uncharacterized protein
VKLSRRVRFLLAAVVLTAVSFAAVSAFFAWQFTAPTHRPLGAAPEKYLRDFESVRFRARDGIELAGWFAPAAGATQAVVLLHGFGTTRTQMLARAGFLQAHGYAVLLYDARGHGQSGGERISFGWYETRDLLGALDFLRAKNFHEFGCIGASQGGATIALAAAELRDVRWVVLESVYPTMTDAVDRRFRRTLGVPGWLGASLLIPFAEHRLAVVVRDIAPISCIADLNCPVLIAHGDRDRHTLIDSARELFARAREPKSLWVVTGAAHIDLYGFAKADYERHLLDFIASSTARNAMH